MPQKAEYWSLSEKKVRKLQEKVLIQGQLAWDQLKPYGFTNWNSVKGWIGCWIERTSGATRAIFSIQLEQEEPLRFRVSLELPNENKTDEVVFLRDFDSIESLESSLPEIMTDVKVCIAG